MTKKIVEAASHNSGRDPVAGVAAIPDEFWDLKRVLGYLHFSRSQLYLLEGRGQFVRRIRFSARKSLWNAAEVRAWAASRERGIREPVARLARMRADRSIRQVSGPSRASRHREGKV
jgi:predicted DNA-binding transcriptional regulator AlpA